MSSFRTKLLVIILALPVVLGLGAATAAAQEGGGPYVLDDEQTQGDTGDGDQTPLTDQVEVQGVQTTRSDTTLPLTGTEIAVLVACGLGLVLIGGALVTGSRRSAHT